MGGTSHNRRVEGFDLKDFLPYLLNISGEVTSLGFERTYRDDYGMSRTEWRVLFHLGRYGAMTARDICERSRTHKTKVSRGVKSLAERRFLTRKKTPEDRRFEILQLTDEGRTAYETLCRKAGLYDKRLKDQFTAEETEILLRCLRKLAEL